MLIFQLKLLIYVQGFFRNIVESKPCCIILVALKIAPCFFSLFEFVEDLSLYAKNTQTLMSSIVTASTPQI